MIGGGQEGGAALRHREHGRHRRARRGAGRAGRGRHLPQPRRAGRACASALAGALREAFPGIVFNAPFEHALPTTLNFAVPGMASKRAARPVRRGRRARQRAARPVRRPRPRPATCWRRWACRAWQQQRRRAPVVRAAGRRRLHRRGLRAHPPLRPGRAAPAAGGVRAWPAQRRRRCRSAARAATAGSLFDHGARACVAIDPPAGLAGADRRRGARPAACALLAVLGTGADPDGADARAVLRTRARPATPASRARSAGRATAASSTLADGSTAPASRSAAQCWRALADPMARRRLPAGPRAGRRLARRQCVWPSSAALSRRPPTQALARLVEAARCCATASTSTARPGHAGRRAAAHRRRTATAAGAGRAGRLPARARGRAAGRRARSLRSACRRRCTCTAARRKRAAVAPGRAPRPLAGGAARVRWCSSAAAATAAPGRRCACSAWATRRPGPWPAASRWPVMPASSELCIAVCLRRAGESLAHARQAAAGWGGFPLH